jgi:uncharacterized protein
MITFKQSEDGERGKFLIIEKENPAGEMTYKWADKNKLVIDHVETYMDYRGKNYGKMLVMKGIEYAKAKGAKILPLCSYAKLVMHRDQSLHDMIFK